MKKYVTLICSFLVVCAMSVSAQKPADYGLAWSDEFDGTALNTANWQYDVGGWGWGNNEAEYYTDGLNWEQTGGIGSLIAKKEAYEGKQYTSCRLSSQCKQEFQYGYFEVKLKAPMGRGMWPAFWTLGADFPPYNGYCSPPVPAPWCNCGEIEMYETKTGEPGYGGMGGNTFIGTCHYSGAGGGTIYNSGKVTYTEDLGLQFHVYAILWDETKIQYYFDGTKFWEHAVTASFQTEFHQKHFFLANIAIGGNYQGNNIDNSIFPQKMSIDYIRVYQKGVGVTNKDVKRQTIQSFTLVNPTTARLSVYNLSGKLVADYTNKVRQMKAGDNVLKMMPATLTNGTYVARLTDNGKTVSKTLVSAQ